MSILRHLQAILTGLKGQRGQVLVFTAFGMVMLLGFTAFATDTGLYLRDIRDAQNDADAAVLAGAQELALGIKNGLSNAESEANATAKAQEWAASNGAGGEFECCTFSDYNGDGFTDTIEGTVDRSAPAVFARVVGVDSFPLERSAGARVVAGLGGEIWPFGLCGDETLPPLWGLKAEDGDGIVEDDEVYVIKVGAGKPGDKKCAPETGNFLILDVGGEDDTGKCKSGADGVVWAIFKGGSCYVYIVDDGVEVKTEPGTLGNKVKKALEDYFKAHGESPSNWAYCNDYAANHDDPICAGRYVLVPIIDKKLPPGASVPVEVLDLAPVYVLCWSGAGAPCAPGPPGKLEIKVLLLTNTYIPAWTIVGETDDTSFSFLHPILFR